MQIVIDIPENIYGLLKYFELALNGVPEEGEDVKTVLVKSVINGTPLPKGHGRLIDFDSAIDKYWDGNRMEITAWDITDIPTVIKAEE